MNRQLQNDIEAEAVTLVAEAVRIEAAFQESEMGADALADAIRLYVEPRREAARALRAAIGAARVILPVGESPLAGQGAREIK